MQPGLFFFLLYHTNKAVKDFNVLLTLAVYDGAFSDFDVVNQFLNNFPVKLLHIQIAADDTGPLPDIFNLLLGFPLGGREEVSLSPHAVIAPRNAAFGVQAGVDRSEQSCSSPPGAVHLRGAPDSLVHGLCTGNAVYSVVKLHEGDRPPHLFPRWESGFGLCFSHVFQKNFQFLKQLDFALMQSCFGNSKLHAGNPF